ncbi:MULTISPECIES: glycoside hydrolase family 3 N-terminal domain-containing protein [unclassified Paenibacillus]|uniref:glycoside hydrolase family 3 N-terminal domain-containing protein n=1 Tax=unclassified Paenibacillus TaxID=185978 RepID=UPI00240752C0|nr:MULTISPECIES: glycoside hydrolase family 3 N-terminal domain-containing protein [unclassified Paenibacillus]MDF9845431.1 beta-glucosidase [Paenibacillus sp. PastF-2]MDF9852015.1 beta-glucosidase [Paenibacillus sp. PastM-2]MDF9858578.1 beta-glucosidase [Paenibacillus sp. PastF-1]MDH6483852.1 beta-glucosidase [Paenibacillus sp. PastH-2]MDH6511233.1 beta-glucosidase [Paenibacillus sp. PastM-3]
MTEHLYNKYVKHMTLEEKVAQLLQLAAPFYDEPGDESEITGPMEELGIGSEAVRNAGSVLGVAGAARMMAVQKAHLENNRLGIPLLFMADIVHGFKTIFPIPLAIGSSWNPELAEKSAEIAAREAAVSGLHVTFAPMVDLTRDPRWGRVMESTGEDPYLNGVFAEAFVKGFQGEDLAGDYSRVAACVKHFAAYGAAEGGRDYNTVDLSERQLREYYLPAYKAAVDAGAEMVMTSFNIVDGIPATGNRKLLRDLLRTEWGFDGVIISDWASIKEMVAHGAAEDDKEAAFKAIRAGVDIDMMTTSYLHHLPQLVDEGLVDEALIDEAVLRILQLKEKLGLFASPTRGADPVLEKEIVFSAEHRQAARELAEKSSVLLKNEGVLPLRPEQRVAVIGPFASSGDILGWWSWTGSKEHAVKLSDAMRSAIGNPDLITVAEGSGIETITAEQKAEALSAAEGADVIVLALGESSDMSGEGGSRTNIRLPEAQLELIRAMKELGKPLAVVLFNGRPLDLHGVYDQADAVLEAWFPGSEGGAALAGLLYGRVNPSGRLTMSFPDSAGQIPVYYNHFNTGRPKPEVEDGNRYISKYIDAPNEPLLPFGFGLSYTTFDYEGLTLSSDTMTTGQVLEVKVTITNTGSVTGTETVQLYVGDISGEVVRPVKELKAFRQIGLDPGETTEVAFTIGEEQLRYHHSDLSVTSDSGRFNVYVGANSRDVLSAGFVLLK